MYNILGELKSEEKVYRSHCKTYISKFNTDWGLLYAFNDEAQEEKACLRLLLDISIFDFLITNTFYDKNKKDFVTRVFMKYSDAMEYLKYNLTYEFKNKEEYTSYIIESIERNFKIIFNDNLKIFINDMIVNKKWLLPTKQVVRKQRIRNKYDSNGNYRDPYILQKIICY